MMTVLTSTDTTVTEDNSPTAMTTSTSVTSEGPVTTQISGQTTEPSFSTSPQETSASSQNQHSENSQTTTEPQTSISAPVSKPPLTSFPIGSISTTDLPQETSTSGKAMTLSHSTNSHTPLHTSEMMTVLTSTGTTVREDQSNSVTSYTALTSGGPVTTQVNGQTTKPSFSTSPQETSASSQNQHIENSQTTTEPQTTINTPVSTSTPASLPVSSIPTLVVPKETSISGKTTTAAHSTTGHTPLHTSEMMTVLTSTDTTVTEDNSPSTMTISTSVTSKGTVTTQVNRETTKPYFSTSPQETSASSQNTENSQKTTEPQTSTNTPVSTSTPASLPISSIPTLVVPKETSISGKTTTAAHSTAGHTPLHTSEMMTVLISTDTTATEDNSPSIMATSTSVTSKGTVTTQVNRETTKPSFSTSPQETSSSSQNQHTENSQKTTEPQISTNAPVSTTALLPSPFGSIPTLGVPQGTSTSGKTTAAAHSTAGHTPLHTSEIMTVLTSTDTTVTEDNSPSTMTISTSVTSKGTVTTQVNKETTKPYFSTSPQETSASSQNTENSQKTTEPQTSTNTPVSTTLLTSPFGSIPTSGVLQETSSSGKTTTSFHSTIGPTPLHTSEMMTVLTSTDTTVTEDNSPTAMTTSTSVTSKGTVTTQVNRETRTSSFSTSTQETAASSQNQQTENAQTTTNQQTSISAPVSTQTMASLPIGSIFTTGVPQETSTSGTTVREDQSTSVTSYTALTSEGPVTTQLNGQTTKPSFSTSPQETSASSQNQHTENSQTTTEPQTTINTPVSTSTPASLPVSSIPTLVVPKETSISGKTTTAAHSTTGHTPLHTSEMMTVLTSTDTTVTEDNSPSTMTISTSVTSKGPVTTHVNGQTTKPSFSTSPQETSASSQNQHTENSQTTTEPQTSTNTPVSTSTPASLPASSIPTLVVPKETSISGKTTTAAHSTTGHTPLHTSEMMTVLTSTDTTVTEDNSPSTMTISTSVTSKGTVTTQVNRETTKPYFSTSPQETSASSQNTENSQKTTEPQTSTNTPVSTTLLTSPFGSIPTSGVLQETSSSGKTTTSFHSTIGPTPLHTSEMMTVLTSTDTTVTEDNSPTAMTTSTSVTSKGTVTTQVNRETRTSSFSTSTQETAASSQNQQTENAQTTTNQQTSISAPVSTSTLTSLHIGGISTSGVPQETSTSGKATTLSHSTAGHTPLQTSEMMTVLTSTDTTLREVQSHPGTTTSTLVTSEGPVTTQISGQTTEPSFSTSPQETSASSQNQHSENSQTTTEPQTSISAPVSKPPLTSFPIGSISTTDLPQETSTSGKAMTLSHSTNSHTPLHTSEMMTVLTSTGTTVREDQSNSVTSYTALTSGGPVTTQVNGQTTKPSFSTSPQETSASSQNQHIENSQTTTEPQTTINTPVSTSTPASLPVSSIPTLVVPKETSISGKTTTAAHSTTGHTPLHTSEMMTVLTSTDTTVTEDNSPSTMTISTSVTSKGTVTTQVNGQTTKPSFSTSPQETSASSQNQHTANSQTTTEPKTSIKAPVSTSTPVSLPIASISTLAVSKETSISGKTTTSFHSTLGPTPLQTSEMMTVLTSTDTTVREDNSPSTMTTSTSVTSEGTVTTQVNGQTTKPSFSTSPQETSASSQNQHTENSQTTTEPQTSISAPVSTPTLTSLLTGSIFTTDLPQMTSTSGKGMTLSHSTAGHTPLQTSEMMTVLTSTDTTLREVQSHPVMTTSTLVASEGPVTTQISGQTTEPSLSSSPQETLASSQKQHTENSQTTTEPQTSINAPVSTSTLLSSPFGSIPTSGVSEETSTSAATVTTQVNGQTSQPTSRTSPQETSASSQNQHTENSQTTTEPQSSISAPVSTPTPASLPIGSISTSGVPQETSTSGKATTLSRSTAGHTPLQTSEMMTVLTSTDTTVREDNSHPVMTTSSSVTSESPVTTQVNGQTTEPSFSTSHQETSASSQNQHTENSLTATEPQTSINAPVSTSTLLTSPFASIPTSNVPLETSTSAAVTSVTTQVNGQTTEPSFSTSPQKTSAPSQNQHTVNTETTTEPQTSINTPVSTSTLASSPIGSISTLGVPQETSSSAPGPAVTWSSTTTVTGHPTLLSGASTFPPSTASLSSTVKTQTSGAITTPLRTDSKRSIATSLPSTTSQTLTTSTASTSTGTRSTATLVPTKPMTGVSLFPYGSRVGDWEFVRRRVDFTSPLFKPQIGFLFGSSLRDFLYFTDNGQIVFPESEYQIFSYPNPPRGGFTGGDYPAVVAPFWDNADFSSRRGTIFYQEYETLYDDYKPALVQQVESWIGKFTNTWNYKARWTLKVTWVNAPAYPAQRNFRTNTYQAILSTDGSRSFALFLYQSGGMQWDVSQHLDNEVLMGFSSGDGYYKNSPLTSQPAWEKYRPDQFLNSNSGLRGLQVYQLHREERPNYRLKCLQWLKRQPQWHSWGWNHISCPCSWQQGVWDFRFQHIHIGWWGLSSRQLCSFSSWRGGVCCSYGPWGELLQGWRVWSPWHLEQELEPWNWCCRWNDRPSFCALYQQRRPHISCLGYQPPRPAWMFGDPHITTLDGANYTFNGLGDFLLVRARDGNSSFLLQGRTAQTGSAQATNFIAFAAQYSSSGLAPITVQWFLEPNDTVRVRLNNKTVTFERGEDQENFTTTGIVMTRNGSRVLASLDGTVVISVIALSNILHASCILPEEYRNHTEGLLGVWNGNPDDDFRMPNGTTVHNGTEEMLFHYGMTWEINGTSLFGKRDNHLPSNFTPVFFSQLLKNNSLNKDLTSRCNGVEQCIYDTLATGNRRTGLNTEMLLQSYQQMNDTLNQNPPSIDGPDVVEAYMGQTVQIDYTSSSKDVTFTLRNDHTDNLNISENGTLLWTPNSLEPFTLEILARNVKNNLASVLQPKTVVCACKGKDQCSYNQTSRVGNSSLQVASCKCDNNTFGLYCERSNNLCEEQCFPNVNCNPGRGCESCPPNLTGNGHHCAPLEDTTLCENTSCPVNYCYNHGHCYISQTLGCQPTCTCPPAFTDARCFLAGNSFTPTIISELPLRIIRLFLREEENASDAEVNASVAYRLEKLDVRAFFRNSKVEKIGPPTALASGGYLQQWDVTSEFQYRPRGPVIDFLNTRLLDAVLEAFLLEARPGRWKRSEQPRNNVVFHAISRRGVLSVKLFNESTLQTYLKCNGYKDYRLVYSPRDGFTCVSPCREGYCEHGGQCQHLPDGPRCSCVPFSIYAPWGEHCEHLSMKLGAFFGILFGVLGALLLLGAVVFVGLRFWGFRYSYPLDSES
ncbi:mucin-4 isoform X5 [Saccopteryx bilineata]|uniref:mucin-4 isoform X5 n=1 Tax=Saccopteryx bilineata TaxID=59482 RepID=UPI00338E6990